MPEIDDAIDPFRRCEGCGRRLPRTRLDQWGWCPDCVADELDRYLSDQYDEVRERQLHGREAWL